MIDLETAIAAMELSRISGNELALRFEEKAAASAVLQKPVELTPEGARSLALILREHGNTQMMLLGVLKDHRNETVRALLKAEHSSALAARAVALVDQIQGFGFWDMIGFWRRMKADARESR